MKEGTYKGTDPDTGTGTIVDNDGVEASLSPEAAKDSGVTEAGTRPLQAGEDVEYVQNSGGTEATSPGRSGETDYSQSQRDASFDRDYSATKDK